MLDQREWPPRAGKSGSVGAGPDEKEQEQQVGGRPAGEADLQEEEEQEEQEQEERQEHGQRGGKARTSIMWLRRVHLDEQFCAMMDQRLGRCLDHKLDDEFTRKYQLDIKNKLTHSLLAHLLIFYGRLCRMHFHSGRWTLSAVGPGQQDNLKDNHNRNNNNNIKSSKSWLGHLLDWPNVVAALHFMSTALLSTGLYYHYVHDQFVFHLRRFSQAQETGQYILMADYANSNVTREKLLRKVNETRPLVKAFGAPILEATYGSECAYLYALMLANLTYLNTWIYGRFVNSFNFYVVRLLLNRTEERRNFNRLICEQVNKYIQSSCNFTEAFIDRCIQLNGLKRFRLEHLNTGSELRRLLLDYKTTIRSLKQMALEGSLQPINRTDVWIDWLTELFGFACLGLKSIPLTFYVVAFTLVPVKYYNFKFQLEPMDLVAAGALTILWLLAALSSGFYVALTIINCLDQTNMIEHLGREIRSCIDDNAQAFRDHFIGAGGREAPEQEDRENQHIKTRKSVATIDLKIKDNPKGKEEQQEEEEEDNGKADRLDKEETKQVVSGMNNRLLFVFMHYKIFVAQLRPIKSSFGFFCMSSLFVIFLLPIIGRLHLPYMSTNIKVLVIAMGLATLVVGNLCIAPICHLHLRCLKLYKCLCCLLAHLVDVASNSAELSANSPRIYDQHTIWMVRKELNHPDRMANQFATKSFGLSFVYPNLIRINFWFSLIMLSILTDVRSDQEEVIGSLTSDPLGIFTLEAMDYN